MKSRISLYLCRRNVYALTACLLTFSLITMPFVQITIASSGAERQVGNNNSDSRVTISTEKQNYRANPNAPLPAPAPEPMVPSITATKVDALISDDGDGKADPGGTEKIEYTVTITNNGTDAADVVFSDDIDAHTTLVNGTLNTQPIADPDTYAASGNIAISKAAPGVLANDRDPDTGDATGLTVTKVQGVGANVGAATDTTASGRGGVKGSVTLNSDGGFTYEPPPGFEGADSFTYEISDGTKTDTATVTVNISGMVWFISNNAGGSNRGTFSNPFTTIASFNTANAASGVAPDPKNGDIISLRLGTGTYSETDGVNLRAQQKLIGNAVQFNTVFSAAADSIAAYTTFAGATTVAPVVSTSGGNGVDLSTDNHVRGLNVNNTPGFFKINGGAVGSPVINTMNLTGTGGALSVLISGNFGANVSFGTLESTSSPGPNLNLNSVTGALGITSGGAGFSGSAATFVAVNVNGGTVAFTYPGNVAKINDGSLVSISGGHNTGTITFTGTLSASAGDGLQFNNADGTYNFNGATTLNGGNAGIDILNGSSGTFNFSASTSITSPTGTAFNVASSPGNPTVTYSGSITHNTAGQRAVNVDGTTGGSVSIATVTAGSIAGGVGNTGVNINNAGGSVTITTLNLGTSGTRMTAQAVTIAGGAGAKTFTTVSIFTTGTAQGIVSTTSTGSITIGAGTVDTAGAAALNLAGTSNASRTPLNIQLQQVKTTGGASGIVLSNTSATGSPGGFRILGSGGTCTNASTAGCSGGEIASTTGADSTTLSAGSGIHMTNVDTVVLTRMHIHDHQNYGIRGVNVNGFTLDTSVIKGVNGTNPGGPFSDGSVVFDGTGAAVAQGLVGSASITNSDIRGGRSDNLRIDNDAGTLNLTITGSTFRDTTDAADANDNIFIEFGNTATGFVSITGSTFGETSGDHIQGNLINTAIGHFTITGNTFTGIGSAKPGTRFGMGILIAGGQWTGTCRYNISNNTMSGTRQGHAIHTNKGGPGGGTMEGTISNNTIGVAANAESGASESSGITVASRGNAGIHRAVVSGNTIHQTDEMGINLELGEDGGVQNNADAGATSGSAAGLQVTVINNTIDTPGPNALHGIHLNSGVLPGDNNLGCADIGGGTAALRNHVTAGANEGNGGSDIRPRQRQATRVELPGYGGTAFDNTAVQNYISGRNDLTTVAATNSNAAGTVNDGFFNTAGGAACAQPTAPTLPSGPLMSSNGSSMKSDAVASVTVKADTATAVSNEPSLFARAMTGLVNFASSVVAMVEPTAHASSETVRVEPAAPATVSVVQASQLRAAPVASNVGRQKLTVKPANNRSRTNSHHATLRSPRAMMAAAMSGENVSVTIGTLRAGDSVTITFQVTVDDPPNLTLLNPPRVRNQGTVSGSNFTSVLTDDTAAVGAADPTDTEVDLFNTTTSLVSDINPSNFGDTVTFTATVAEDPTQPSADPSGTVDFIDTSNGDAVVCDDVALASGQAQCQTSTLTSGTHNIRADYSGDGNFDPSMSNVVAQVVNACSQDPIVTTTADDGAGSLREALADVCTGDTITFDIAGDGPHTILLTTGELQVAKNVTVHNNSGESITVSGNNASRAFNINSGTTAAIIGLTISGGAATDGAGIINDGTLTVANSTLTGNAASADGGAIATTATSTSLTLINTTISGNSAAGSGGGVIVLGGIATSVNSTITNNVADSDNNAAGSGGGIRADAGTTTLKNTIVAGNFNEDGPTDAADDISGTVDVASSFNLIGTGGAGGLTNGVNNNQVGVADAGLGSLANNGGTTQTHALLPTSVAVEAGSNANLPADTFDLDGDVNTAETLPVDQRGTGFPRVADSQDVDAVQTVDIGAFELHPSVEDIADKSVAEDTLLSFSFNLGDGTGSLIASVTATSDNAALIPNANISVTGTGSTRTLDITPAANANSPSDGTATITVTVTATNGRTATDTFVVTVTEVNDNPVAGDDTLTAIDEDSGTRVIPFADLLANDSAGPANENGQTLNITNVSNPVGGTVAINGTNVEFTPTANFFGSASFDYTVTDNGTTNAVSDPKSDTGSVSFTINAINDPPSFTIAADPPASNEDGGPQTVLNFATDISAGPNETGQVLTFNITPNGSTGTLTFSSGPAIDATTGTLTYTATGDTNGTATFDVTLSDDGSNVPPNSNTSAAQSFTITVNAQNDNPVVTTTGGNLLYTENDAATAIDPGVTVTDGDSPNLVGATVAITAGFVSAQDTLGFMNQLGITGIYNSGTGVLTLSGTASVANYQTALRSVTYQNSSDNPTLTRTVTFTADDGVGTGSGTRGISITAVNDAPINTVPGPQGTNQNTPLIFSSGNGNQISVADADAGTADIRVTLTATNGTVTLATTAGLSFSAGDGTADITMTFDGTLTEVNTAMNGMNFTPDAGFSGAASLTITSNDLGNSGTGGPLSDTDVVNIQVATNISIQDAQLVEPESGSANMLFTVTLSAPAPAGGASVDFTTVQEAPALNHATAGDDYTTTSGTVNFSAGEQVKTIAVPILSDSKKNEANETFLVVLSNPMNATIADGTATGTILVVNQAGTILIKELRTSGPAGAGDDFVEIYNNTDTAHTVNGASGGYGLFKMGASCGDTPILIGVIPNGTVIPARGHYLFVGSAYSLANYGGTGAAAGDQTLTSDIEDDRNVGIFSTASLAGLSTVTRFDAVGFGSNTGGTCDLLREGPTLAPLSGSVLEYSYFRDECGKKGNPAQFGACPTGGFVKDSNSNGDDFIFVDTQATMTPAGQRLGAPGPENLGSPRFNLSIAALLLDNTKGSTASPNRVRDTTAIGPNAANGTLSIRRRFVNNTGAPVTRLRFRVVDISAFPVSNPIADLRVLSSMAITVTGVQDSATCLASNGSATTPCTVTVEGTTLETPPAQPLGGALNSSLNAGTIFLAQPLAPGASINLQFLLGVQNTGSFKFFFNIEALP